VLLGVWDAFHKNGIVLPYPQQDVHIKSVMREEDLKSLMAVLRE